MKKLFLTGVLLVLLAIGTASAAITVGVSTDKGTYDVGDKITVTATVYDGSTALNNVTVTTAIRFVATNSSYWSSFGTTGSGGIEGTVTWNDATVGAKWYNGTYSVKANASVNAKWYSGSTTITVNNPGYTYPQPKPKPKYPSTVCP